MQPADLRRRLRRLAARRGWDFDEAEGASHKKLMLNGRRTVIGRHRVDLKPGTFSAILK
jgi:HicA toxin of bacterial toxin-antitoxin,